MDLVALLRTLGGLGIVLGLLAGALWAVRRYDLSLPGRTGMRNNRRRVEVIERVTIDGKRVVVLVRRDDREHLFVLTGDRATVLETRIIRADEEAADAEDVDADHQGALPVADRALCTSLEEAWYRG